MSVNVSNLAIGYNEAEMIATLKSSAGTKKFDTLNSFTLSKTQSYSLTANATFTTIKIISTKTQYLQLLYSNSTYNKLFIYDKSMMLSQTLILPIIGKVNFTICED